MAVGRAWLCVVLAVAAQCVVNDSNLIINHQQDYLLDRPDQQRKAIGVNEEINERYIGRTTENTTIHPPQTDTKSKIIRKRSGYSYEPNKPFADQPPYIYPPPNLDLPSNSPNFPPPNDFPSNSYLPPKITPPPSLSDPIPTEDTIVVTPPTVYLPPDGDFVPNSYLPPKNPVVPSRNLLPPKSNVTRTPKSGFIIPSLNHNYLNSGFKIVPNSQNLEGLFTRNGGSIRSPLIGYVPPSFNDDKAFEPPASGYIPPPEDDIPGGGNRYLAPPSDELPPDNEYLPPQPPEDEGFPDDSPGYSYEPPKIKFNHDSNSFRILNMSCSDSEKFFKASFRSDLAALVESGSGSCVTPGSGVFRLDLVGDDMKRCGVKQCGAGDRSRMCVTLRMAAVPGLKLKEDDVVTLQCKPMDKVAAQTKHLQMNTVDIQSRSAGQVAEGGHQRRLRTRVELLRGSVSPSGEVQGSLLPVGATVALGEPLVLQAQVLEGDGWRFSRMGSVRVRRTTLSDRTAGRALQLVDERGCGCGGALRALCPGPPKRLGLLKSVLPLRAFMFQEAAHGDQLVVSVRMLACMHAHDCNTEGVCDGSVSGRRRKRHANTSDEIEATDSYISFRVEARGEPENSRENNVAVWCLVAGVIAALMGLGGVCLVFKKCRGV